jgi:excisionase family DNA binding protein
VFKLQEKPFTTKMQEKFLTTEQVANILQVHPFTILKFIKQGKLKGIKLGRVYRIKESDVELFIEERTTGVKVSKKEANKPESSPPSNSLPEHSIPRKADGDTDHYYII